MPAKDTDKRAYYARPDIVQRYDRWRFASAGGRYVNQRELDAIAGMLADVPRDGGVLDLPCGTGRLLERLQREGFRRLEGADNSQAMLDASRARCGADVSFSQRDAFATGFDDASFAAVVSLRFFFHWPDPAPLLNEFSRVLRPGGHLVFDTLRRSPRSRGALVQKLLGGKLWTLSDDAVRAAVSAAGLEVVRSEAMLLLPSLAYRGLFGPAVRVVDGLEARLPDAARTKVVWLCRRRAGTGN